MDVETKQGLQAPPARPSIINVLENARARIAKGWAQGKAAMRSDTPCAGIAIGDAADDLNYGSASSVGLATREAFAAANELPDPLDAIVGWNDKPGRTQAEVLAAFDRAIALATRDAP